MTTIYIDILLILNIYVNFFLLKATARFMHLPLRNVRCVISSVVGSLFSLSILIPFDNLLMSVSIKIAASFTIVFICFGIKDMFYFFKICGFFYIINFIFAGIVGFMYNIFTPSFMAFNNSYFYVDFSLLSLIVFTAIAYFAVSFFRRFLDKSCDTAKKYSVRIKYNDNIIKTEAIADTGNSLIDSITGRPVVICPHNLFSFPEDIYSFSIEDAYLKYGFRMIPYSTIDTSSLIPIFLPDELLLIDEENGRHFSIDAFVGIVLKDTPAIFNPKLLI